MKAVRFRNAGSLAILLATSCFLILTTSAAGQNNSSTKGGDALLIVTEALLAVDMLQTQYILKHDDEYEELNPIINALGPNYAPLYFLGWMIALPVLGELIFPQYREWIYGVAGSIELITVTNNFGIGVKLDF